MNPERNILLTFFCYVFGVNNCAFKFIRPSNSWNRITFLSIWSNIYIGNPIFLSGFQILDLKSKEWNLWLEYYHFETQVAQTTDLYWLYTEYKRVFWDLYSIRFNTILTVCCGIYRILVLKFHQFSCSLSTTGRETRYYIWR